ncbi:DNA replication and repair protein RecO [Marininema mesophilum]|uniref:DNA repair protein RecO n=1 Tax=Marininema mesophilum TaxID=1048340 RepID=A0A1H2R592_9BACL|nr:DNA repair protein RecO [Marininema mesophilum]SDW14034.1 DNA replication and repair protein RecO [Marininema mesophilum]
MLTKIEGVVLRTRDYGESNKIVTIFTREQGKFAVMARGAKKPKSRLGAATQPFTLGFFLCFSGSGMGTITQAEILESHVHLRSDLLYTAYAAYWVKYLDNMIQEKEPAPLLYELLLSMLNRLEAGVDPEILSRIFELRVLESAGYRPHLDRCVSCRGTEEPFAFSVQMGGILCSNCFYRDPHRIPLSSASARILKQLQRMTPDRLGQVQVREETQLQLERVMRCFSDEYTGLKLKSRIFLDQLKRDWGKERK